MSRRLVAWLMGRFSLGQMGQKAIEPTQIWGRHPHGQQGLRTRERQWYVTVASVGPGELLCLGGDRVDVAAVDAATCDDRLLHPAHRMLTEQLQHTSEPTNAGS